MPTRGFPSNVTSGIKIGLLSGVVGGAAGGILFGVLYGVLTVAFGSLEDLLFIPIVCFSAATIGLVTGGVTGLTLGSILIITGIAVRHRRFVLVTGVVLGVVLGLALVLFFELDVYPPERVADFLFLLASGVSGAGGGSIGSKYLFSRLNNG